MAKKKTTPKKEESPIFNLSDIKEGTEQVTEVDKQAIESEEPEKKDVEQITTKKPVKKKTSKTKMGRPRNPDPVEIHKFLLRLPKDVVEKLDADLETDKITGRKESRNNYILRAILLQLKRKK